MKMNGVFSRITNHDLPACRSRTLVSCLTVVATAIALSLFKIDLVHAQEERQDRRAVTIEEITVTARRVEESLQETPVSVTAFSRQDLEGFGVSEIGDISHFTPNLEITKQVSSQSNLVVGMRGMMEVEQALSVDPSVGMYLDGVYLSRQSGMSFDILDPARIEVMRGPQGTLFGRNTIGGAVNIVSEKPHGELGFRQDVTFGNRGRARYRSTLDTPRIGNVAAKLTYMRTEFDGVAKSAIHGGDVGGHQSDSARLALNWVPGDAVSVDYIFFISRKDEHGDVAQPVHARPIITNPNGELYGGAFYETVADGVSQERQNSLPIGPRGLNGYSNVNTHALTVEWDVRPDLTVKSISSYRDSESSMGEMGMGGTFPAPNDGSLCPLENYDFVTTVCTDPVPGGQLVSILGSSGGWEEQEQITQELQFIGNAFDNRLRYTTGLYYFKEEGANDSPLSLAMAAPALLVGTDFEVLQPLHRGNSVLINIPRNEHRVDNTSYAAYGNFTVDVTRAMEATLGLRYTRDRKEASIAHLLLGNLTELSAGETWSNIDPSFTLNYHWTDRLMTYLTVARGYRSGGFNIRTTDEEAFRTPFDEEQVISYEIGWKSEWLDRSLRFNGAVFYADYKDQQVLSLVADEEGGTSDIINAGEAVHSGIEVEVLWHPFAGARVMLSYAYLDVDIKEFITQPLDPITALPTSPEAEDVSGSIKPIFAPKHSGSLSAEYRFAPLPWGQPGLRADLAYSDAMHFGNPQLTRFNSADSRILLNARAMLSDIPVGGRGDLQVSLWGKNLSNEKYRTIGQDLGVLGVAQNIFGELRSYGLDITYNFRSGGN